MAFAAWAEEIPSKIYQIPPGALAGRPQISPELAGRTTITHRSSSVRGLPCGAIFECLGTADLVPSNLTELGSSGVRSEINLSVKGRS